MASRSISLYAPPFLNSRPRPFSHQTLMRLRMSSPSSSSAPLPVENGIVVGVGGVNVDFLAAVASYPKPDDKIRTTSLKVQGGGNAGNALTCAARLGLNARIISKIADDAQGRGIREELEADGVDTSFLVVAKEGISPFTYVIVDNQTNTRTCIHTPGYPPMIPDDLSRSSLLSALDGARLIYSDIRLHETALAVAQEAARMNIPLLIDAEKKREGLDDLMKMATYIVCSAKFPQEWTEAPTIPSAITSILHRLPGVKFVVVTLGEDGCIMLERRNDDASQTEELDVDGLFDALKHRKDESVKIPTCVSSPVAKLKADGIGIIHGRLFLGTAEKIPSSELVDTTGAGDAFIGAILYGICADMQPETMLPFASRVAAACCRALGARTGLPHGTECNGQSILGMQWPETLPTVEEESLPDKMTQILQKFEQTFHLPTGLPPMREHDHTIILEEGVFSINVHLYRYPVFQKDETERAINKESIKDCFSIWVIAELVDKLDGAAIFSKLDLRLDYHQIRKRKEDGHKTGISYA